MKHAIVRLTVLASMVAVVGHAASSHATLAVAGRANAAASIAALGKIAVTAWAVTAPGGATDIYAARSTDGGRTFGAPVRVNDVARDASVGGEQPPHVALVPRPSGEPSIVVVWTAKRKEGTRILSAQSNDGGATFGKARPLAGGEAPGNRGWEAITTDREGGVVFVWLDHRETASSSGTAAPMQHEGHDHAGGAKAPGNSVDGAVRAQMSKLYFSRGEEEGRAVAAGVCYCCKTAVAAGADGSIYAAWRHVYPGNIRDIAFTVSRDGGRTFGAPLRVSDDRWVLDGCPENGPAMALDSRQRVHIVWPTLVSGQTPDAEPTLDLFYASSSDGRSFTPRTRLPAQGLPRHVNIAAMPDDSLVAVWEEQAAGTRRIVMGRARGGQPFTRRIVSGGERASYPVVASTEVAALVAWTAESNGRSSIQVSRVTD
jgi:hypothetical protein